MQYNDMNKYEESGFVKDVHISWDYCHLQRALAFSVNCQNTEKCLRWLLGMFVLPHN